MTQQPQLLTPHLTFRDDDNASANTSPLHCRAEQSSPVEQQVAFHLTDDSFQDILSEEEEEEKDFLPASKDVDVGIEELIPDRHFCNHMTCALTLAHTAWNSYTHTRKCTNTTL